MKTETRTIDFSEIVLRAMPKVGMSLAMALVIVFSARASFMTPVSPVPVTLQTGAVILAGFLLGRRWGAVSVIMYLAMGFMGAPVFAMGYAGPSVVLQPSFGYLIAFPLAAWLAGSFAALSGRGYLRAIAYGIVAIILIYVVGGMWLAGYLAIGGMGIRSAMVSAVTTGMAPFVIVDSLKVLLVAGIWCIMPDRAVKALS